MVSQVLGAKLALTFAWITSVKMVAPASKLVLLLLGVSVLKDSQALSVRLAYKIEAVLPTPVSMVVLALKALHQPIAVHAQ